MKLHLGYILTAGLWLVSLEPLHVSACNRACIEGSNVGPQGEVQGHSRPDIWLMPGESCQLQAFSRLPSCLLLPPHCTKPEKLPRLAVCVCPWEADAPVASDVPVRCVRLATTDGILLPWWRDRSHVVWRTLDSQSEVTHTPLTNGWICVWWGLACWRRSPFLPAGTFCSTLNVIWKRQVPSPCDVYIDLAELSCQPGLTISKMPCFSCI